MNELHENLFKLLIELDDLCREHDIDYVLSGGTALGAIRNQCFLPWDDDIDLFITRDNWKKLFELVTNHPEVLPENRDFICMENTKYYRNPIIRYVDTSTTRMYASQAVAAKTCGDQIEFFILDPIPNVEDGQEEHLKMMDVFFEVLSPYFVVSQFLSLDGFEEHKKLVNKYYKKIEEDGFSKVIKELYKKGFTYPAEKADNLRLRWGMRNGIYKSRFFSGKRYEMLEGRKFPVAYELEHALRNDYGDTWMYIPEGTGQVSHNFIIDDTNRSFKDFSDIYLKFVSQKKVVNSYQRNKRNNIELWNIRREVDLEKEKLNEIVAKKEIDKIIESHGYDVEDLLKNRQFDTLNHIFDRYYSIQLNQNCKRYGMMVELDSELLKIAILSKLQQGHYYAADSILAIIEDNVGLNDFYRHLREICEYCRKLSIAIYDNYDVGAVGELLNDIPQDYSNLIDVFRATLWYKLKTAKSDEDYDEIINQGSEMLEYYPNDGELMSHIAEAYFNLNNMDKAKEFYEFAVNNTRNGFVWRKAKENVGIDRMAREEVYVI